MDRRSLTSKAHLEHLLNETEMTQYYLFTAEEDRLIATHKAGGTGPAGPALARPKFQYLKNLNLKHTIILFIVISIRYLEQV